MHCRGSSKKQEVDFDEKLMILMLHDFELFLWIQQGYDQFSGQPKMRMIQRVASKYMRIMNESSIFIKGDKYCGIPGTDCAMELINLVKLGYSDYEMITVYTDSDVKDYIKAFTIDAKREKIIIICETENTQSGEMDYSFKIFDMAKQEMDLSVPITDDVLVGRLLSGLYTFVDGHIYFNNNVVKIRYDLIADPKGVTLTEEIIFDKYFDIFPMKSNLRVQSNTPIDSYLSHRFAYIIQDENFLEPRVIRILPYLHERKIFLNEITKNTSNFYTAIETSIRDEQIYNEKIRENYGLAEDKPPGTGEKSIEMTKNESVTNLANQEPSQEENRTYTAIVSMSIRRKRFNAYAQNGILINSVDFNQIYEDYGEPWAVSPDGKKFLFKLKESQLSSHVKMPTR